MKQHPLCTDTEHQLTVLDLPIPAGIKQEWAAIETRRRFLGRTGKVLGWAALVNLLGGRALIGDAHAADTKGAQGLPSGEYLRLPHFAPRSEEHTSELQSLRHLV